MQDNQRAIKIYSY